MIKMPFYYMLLAVRPVFSTSVASAERKKGSRRAGQKGKEQAVPTPTVRCRELPPACLSLLGKKARKESGSETSGAACPWQSGVATQLPSKDLLTNSG